jgi:hypothetical protein
MNIIIMIMGPAPPRTRRRPRTHFSDDVEDRHEDDDAWLKKLSILSERSVIILFLM